MCDLILALEVDHDVFHGEASFLTQTAQHVTQSQTGASRRQAGRAIGHKHTAVLIRSTRRVRLRTNRTRAAILRGRP